MTCVCVFAQLRSQATILSEMEILRALVSRLESQVAASTTSPRKRDAAEPSQDSVVHRPETAGADDSDTSSHTSPVVASLAVLHTPVKAGQSPTSTPSRPRPQSTGSPSPSRTAAPPAIPVTISAAAVGSPARSSPRPVGAADSSAPATPQRNARAAAAALTAPVADASAPATPSRPAGSGITTEVLADRLMSLVREWQGVASLDVSAVPAAASLPLPPTHDPVPQMRGEEPSTASGVAAYTAGARVQVQASTEALEERSDDSAALAFALGALPAVAILPRVRPSPSPALALPLTATAPPRTPVPASPASLFPAVSPAHSGSRFLSPRPALVLTTAPLSAAADGTHHSRPASAAALSRPHARQLARTQAATASAAASRNRVRQTNPLTLLRPSPTGGAPAARRVPEAADPVDEAAYLASFASDEDEAELLLAANGL